MNKNAYLSELVDHHINDFYEEFPGTERQEHTKTRHNFHKTFHDWLNYERRLKTTEIRPKTTEQWSKPTRKVLRDGLSYNYNDKQKKGIRDQTDSNNDSNLHENTKTTKGTTESLNKYHVKIHKHGRQYLHKPSDSEYDLHNRKYSKTTEIKTTTESTSKYQANNKRYDDDDFYLHKITRTTTSSESPNEYHTNKQKYEDDDFNFYKNTKTSVKTTSESPNKYYVKSKKYEDDDFNFQKNIKTTDKTTSKFRKIYHANKQNRKDHVNFHKPANITDKFSPEYPNKYHAYKQKYEHNDFGFYKNSNTAEKSVTESPNKYTNKQNYEGNNFRKSTDSDKLENTMFTTNIEMRALPKKEYYSKTYERPEQYSHKLPDFEEDPQHHVTYTTETRTGKGYHLKELENTKIHKSFNFNIQFKTSQSTESTENKITTPLKEYYSKVHDYKNYIQESSKSDDNVTKCPKVTHTTEIKTLAASQSPKSKQFVLKSLALKEHNPTLHKHDEKVLYFYEPHSYQYGLEMKLSQATDIGSINTVSKTSTVENFELPKELIKDDLKPHRLQTEAKLETKWTWPTFEDMLEEIGKKYDWRKDRWIEVRRHDKKMTKSDFINNFQEKHKFSYSTIKLNSTKSRRNVVIAVTAVR